MNKQLPTSVLIKSQSKKVIVEGFRIDGGHGKLVINIRYDDQYGNKHNTFSITADMYRDNRVWSGGCLHDDIIKYSPELAYLIKWHLVSSDGPMHYTANTMYHALEHGPIDGYLYFSDKSNGLNETCMKYGKIAELEKIAATNPDLYSVQIKVETAKVANIEAARSCAIWPEATHKQLLDKIALEDRLPALMLEFKSVIEGLGFIY